ncbi:MULTISPECIES: stage V sporulation protein E [Clostridium]|uniref:Probable peptidoglycan glycosyltransferase FtsW n=1 Tax=Clostridium cadaveris TaxID=1529 RepID=A0A1I2J569_9CLOT|nr:stage V sporulation protein E [Clostridium cadaveris]MDU4951473.1 stage V sporulation protein E [Clostridium sp.]MDM8312469.1 stage V sporulation protein E [Clostridium cadaveris]NME63200.1 stage V sporulation protein E [Clostridium cadaveris]NWK10262.1 stage V sporulation protein E [Clostridium cadaveris]UFH63489.1 stage V sporulation protein E [Clostridium cadaveris]
MEFFKDKKKQEVDFVLFTIVMLLLAIGIIMVYSASSYSALYKDKDSMLYLKKQLIFGTLGVISMMIVMKIDYHKYKKWSPWILLGCIPLLLLVFVFPDRNGAQRWIEIGPLTFQPSELTKYAIVLFLSSSVANKGERIKDLKQGLFPYLLVSGFYAGLILAEKNLSIATVIMMVTLIILFVAGAKAKHIFGLVVPALGAAVLALAFSADYRRARMLNFLNPWKDAAGDGYQLVQSFYALGSGKLLGLGLGNSRQKCFYMPEPHNDFIFSIIGEELGFVGAVFVISLFILFIWRGILIAQRAKDTYGTLLAIGITSIIAVQAIINIAVVTGSMPVTGVPLPFISYGGTSLVITMTAMGILLNISKDVK